MRINIQKYRLNFRFEAGTSRGVLTFKDSFFVKLFLAETPEIFGIGECAPLSGLSPDLNFNLDRAFESFAEEVSNAEPGQLEKIIQNLPKQFPALRFAAETALLDLKNGSKRQLFANDFVHGKSALPINGLVWMGDKQLMLRRLKSKIEEGFDCIKIKIGGIAFKDELELLRYIRMHYTVREITVRLDANGAFMSVNALEKLDQLAEFDIHSIEQPIRQGNWDAMADICDRSPIPVALDEELIGINEADRKIRLLEAIKPAYIILKPTLLGGFASCREWIKSAEERNIGWWITSALESNIGLNAVAQFTASYSLNLPQGLGTGQLFYNNIPSPLVTAEGSLRYDSKKTWDLSMIE